VHAASRGTIGLRDDKRNFVTGLQQAGERPRGKFWRAGED
jgi:hypothetical protein